MSTSCHEKITVQSSSSSASSNLLLSVSLSVKRVSNSYSKYIVGWSMALPFPSPAQSSCCDQFHFHQLTPSINIPALSLSLHRERNDRRLTEWTETHLFPIICNLINPFSRISLAAAWMVGWPVAVPSSIFHTGCCLYRKPHAPQLSEIPPSPVALNKLFSMHILILCMCVFPFSCRPLHVGFIFVLWLPCIY